MPSMEERLQRIGPMGASRLERGRLALQLLAWLAFTWSSEEVPLGAAYAALTCALVAAYCLGARTNLAGAFLQKARDAASKAGDALCHSKAMLCGGMVDGRCPETATLVISLHDQQAKFQDINAKVNSTMADPMADYLCSTSFRQEVQDVHDKLINVLASGKAACSAEVELKYLVKLLSSFDDANAHVDGTSIWDALHCGPWCDAEAAAGLFELMEQLLDLVPDDTYERLIDMAEHRDAALVAAKDARALVANTCKLLQDVKLGDGVVVVEAVEAPKAK